MTDKQGLYNDSSHDETRTPSRTNKTREAQHETKKSPLLETDKSSGFHHRAHGAVHPQTTHASHYAVQSGPSHTESSFISPLMGVEPSTMHETESHAPLGEAVEPASSFQPRHYFRNPSANTDRKSNSPTHIRVESLESLKQSGPQEKNTLYDSPNAGLRSWTGHRNENYPPFDSRSGLPSTITSVTKSTPQPSLRARFESPSEPELERLPRPAHAYVSPSLRFYSTTPSGFQNQGLRGEGNNAYSSVPFAPGRNSHPWPPPPYLRHGRHSMPISAPYSAPASFPQRDPHQPHPPSSYPRVRKGNSRSRSRSKSHRRRNSSKAGENYDSSMSVTLVAPTFVPGMANSDSVAGPRVAERPPGGVYWALVNKRVVDDDGFEPSSRVNTHFSSDSDSVHLENVENSIAMPIQMCQPPLYNIMPAYPQALDADPQPRVRKQSKYTAEQDRMILDLKIKGKSWAEIANLAGCHNQLAARNRYQVLIGQQGGGTFFWSTEDCAALQDSLDEAERAKWIFLAEELSKELEEEFTVEMVHYKVASMFAANPEQFGVIRTTDPSCGGAPFERTLLYQDSSE